MPTTEKQPKPCRNCGNLTKAKMRRCYTCQRKNRSGEFAKYKRKSWVDEPGPSQAELERTIAEQSQRLPPWWDNSEHRTGIRESDARPGIRVFHVRADSVAKRQPYLW